MKRDFPDGFALVIGGSGGTGAVICERLVAAGSNVLLTYHHNQARAEALCAQLRAGGRQVDCAPFSLADAGQCRTLIDQLAAQTRIHTVVIAAGSDIQQLLIRELPPESWRQVIEADLNGFFNVVHAALPHMRRAGGGSFVHISSAGLHRWPARDVLSVAPKAAIDSLIKGIAKEEGEFGIRANSVAIGVINAGIFKRLWADGSFDEDWKNAVQAGLCIKRWGEPEEVADAVVYLASNQAAYITGQMLSVDGGYGV